MCAKNQHRWTAETTHLYVCESGEHVVVFFAPAGCSTAHVERKEKKSLRAEMLGSLRAVYVRLRRKRKRSYCVSSPLGRRACDRHKENKERSCRRLLFGMCQFGSQLLPVSFMLFDACPRGVLAGTVQSPDCLRHIVIKGAHAV